MTFVVAQTDRPLIDWSWLGRNLDDIWSRTLEHIYLTVLAVGIGLVISLALAAIALRWPKTYNPIASMGALIYTIPSLALFAFVVPFTGFSVTTAEIALVSYTILILVRNIHAGITGVPPGVVEAADGMGYRPIRRFVQIQLPLAVPVIVAGIRVATVTVVGLVTVTALIGQGGLGFFILDGIRRSIVFPTEIIVGTVLSAVLAAVLDLGLLGVEWAITPWKRGRR